ncbi:MAG: hypothetical protein E7458_08995 [Ruminococcaceae bacterium]|nr:hypothetical protein [Oscillospiraceae bacterium]
MRRRAVLLLLAALFLTGLTGCVGDHRAELLEIGLRHPGGYICSHRDTHGGFHGDGETEIRFYVPDIREEDLCGLPGWQEGPLPEGMETILYGGEYEGVHYGAYPESAPAGEIAYWFFLDRQNEKTHYTEEELWAVRNRPSANFTVALWLRTEQTIWYYRFDS